MGALALVAGLLAASATLRVCVEEFKWLQSYAADTGVYSETALSTWVTRFLQRTSRAMAAFTIWVSLDKVWLPWLNLQDVVMGWGDWRQVDPLIRAAVAGGWFIALAAVLLAFCLGI